MEKEIPKKETLVEMIVDPEMTDGGIRINEIKYVGLVKVPKDIAEELSRIQSEYFETKKRISDPSTFIRSKSSVQVQKAFLADPRQFSNNSRFSRDYGLCDSRDFHYQAKPFQEQLLAERKALYGY